MSIPHLFRCPISLDLFTDPVTLCTGQTYDRYGIEKWLEAGNLTCPVTMQPLYDATFVPNHTLRHLVEQWLLTGPDINCLVKQPGLGTNPGTTSDMEISLTAIRCILESESAAAGSKIDVLRKVKILSIESDVGRACLIQLGFFPLLLELIFQSPVDLLLSNLELLELSLDCVLIFSPTSHLVSLNKILTNDLNLASFVLLISQGNAKVKVSFCDLLETISLSEQTRELALIIGQSPHVMRALVSILHKKADALASDACVRAINGLCSLEANWQNAIREGVLHGLVYYLSNNSTKKSDSAKALATLECFLGQKIGKNNLAKFDNLIGVLVKHVFLVSSGNEGSEYAVAMLLMMCRDSAWACDEALNAGVVTQLLFLIQSQCSARAKTKARNLLKLLRLKCRGCDEKL